MKIEMGESLFYSWLRHAKECQIVQTNWKSSPKWDFECSEEIEEMLKELDNYFRQQSLRRMAPCHRSFSKANVMF